VKCGRVVRAHVRKLPLLRHGDFIHGRRVARLVPTERNLRSGGGNESVNLGIFPGDRERFRGGGEILRQIVALGDVEHRIPPAERDGTLLAGVGLVRAFQKLPKHDAGPVLTLPHGSAGSLGLLERKPAGKLEPCALTGEVENQGVDSTVALAGGNIHGVHHPRVKPGLHPGNIPVFQGRQNVRRYLLSYVVVSHELVIAEPRTRARSFFCLDFALECARVFL